MDTKNIIARHLLQLPTAECRLPGKHGSICISTLSVKPTQNVTVALSVTDKSELRVDKKTLTFTPSNWDIPQDVRVSGEDDVIVDGNIKSKVVLKMTSSDKNFDGAIKEIEFTTLDNDKAGLVIQSNAESIREDSGQMIEMKVGLMAQPTANVSVKLKSSDESELKILGQTTLIFTDENWNMLQTVVLKVQDDNLADGTQIVHIDLAASSEDKDFNGITGQSATYPIVDNETP